MRIVIASFLLILAMACPAAAVREVFQLALTDSLSGSLSGATGSGIEFSSFPRSASYGLIGAGFLVLAVLRRRRRLNKMPAGF